MRIGFIWRDNSIPKSKGPSKKQAKENEAKTSQYNAMDPTTGQFTKNSIPVFEDPLEEGNLDREIGSFASSSSKNILYAPILV